MDRQAAAARPQASALSSQGARSQADCRELEDIYEVSGSRPPKTSRGEANTEEEQRYTPSSRYSTVYPEIVQFPVLTGGSQRRMTEVQLLSWAMGRLGAAGTPVETDSRAGPLLRTRVAHHSSSEHWKHANLPQIWRITLSK